MKSHLFTGTFIVAALIAACSGASSSDLFAAASESAASEPDPGSTPPSQPALPPPSSSSGDTSSSSSSSSGGSTSSSSGGSTSSSSSSSGSSGMPIDAGPPPTNGKIWCGESGSVDVTCTAGSQVCCLKGSSVSPSYACTGQLGCNGGIAIRCDDTSDCVLPGQVCCGTLETNTGYSTVQCSYGCTSVGSLIRVRFCDPKVPNECGAGLSCQPSQTLPGYHVCRP